MNKPTLPLDTLEQIGLEGLNGAASLLTRRDRKYLVPLALTQELVGQEGLQVLEIDELRSFRYESVYFDTPDLISYLAAAHKRRRRFKVRTRSYLDSGLCSLEVKTRERRGLTEKLRLPYAIEQRNQLTENGEDFVNRFDTIAPVSRELRPVLTTRYSRATLLERGSGSRITIDTNLQCEAADGSTLSLPDMAIVETKTSGQPCRTDHFLWNAHRRPVKISKYCTSLAALTPGLPANKWNRVLRAYFGWIPEPARAAPGCRNPDPVTQLESIDREPVDRSTWAPSLEGVGS